VSGIPHDLLNPALGLAALVAIASGLIRGFTGFGSAMVNAPLLSLIYGPSVAVPMVASFELAATVQLFPAAARATHWRIALILGLVALITIPVGARFLVSLDPVLMRRGIGTVVVAFSIILMSGWRFSGRPTGLATAGAGMATGLLMGAVGMGGVVPGLYCLAATPTAAAARATAISVGVFLCPTAIAVFAAYGVIDSLLLWRMAALLPVFLAFSWVGARLFRVVSDRQFRGAILVFLLVIGIATLAV
jgi:uncharacterized membrane protein YfcA